MQLYTFKARSLAEALQLVREELGPDASVLHTRDVGSPLARLLGARTIEVTASSELAAPSRLPEPEGRDSPRVADSVAPQRSTAALLSQGRVPAAELQDFRRKFRHDLLAANATESSLVEQLAAPRPAAAMASFPGAGAIADRLRSAGVNGETAARWLQRLEAELTCDPECHPDRMLERLRQIIATELSERILC